MKGARNLSVSILVRKTFYNCIGDFISHRDEATSTINMGEHFTNYAAEILNRSRAKGNNYDVTMLDKDDEVFVVTTVGVGKRHAYINACTCTCKK